MITNIEFREQMEDLIKKINSSYIKSLDPTVDDYESLNYANFKKEFDALIENYQSGGGASSADDVSYDNTDSGLEATDVQAAIDELAESGGGSSLYVVKFTVELDMSTGEPTVVTCDKTLSEIWSKDPDEIVAYCEMPAILLLMDADFPDDWWASQEEMMAAKLYMPVTVTNIIPSITAAFTFSIILLDWNSGVLSGITIQQSAFDDSGQFYIIGFPTDSTGTSMVKGGTVDHWTFTQYQEPAPTPIYTYSDVFKKQLTINYDSSDFAWVNIGSEIYEEYIEAKQNTMYKDNTFYRMLFEHGDYANSKIASIDLKLNAQSMSSSSKLRGGTLYRLYDDISWSGPSTAGGNDIQTVNGGNIIFGATELVHKYDVSTGNTKVYAVNKRLFIYLVENMDINYTSVIDGGSIAPGEVSNINYTEEWLELS